MSKSDLYEKMLDAVLDDDITEAVRLAKLCQPQENHHAMCAAVGNGSHEMVEALLPFYENMNDQALKLAARLGHALCLKLLIPKHRPGICDFLLADCVRRNHTSCVPVVLPYADAKFNNSVALAYASAQGSQEMFDLLYPVSDLHAAISEATNLNFTPRQNKLLNERLNMEQEHRTLTEATRHITNPSKARKI